MTDKHKPENPPAFPLQYDPYVDHPSHGSIHRSSIGEEVQSGMTLRDYFAAKAIQILITDDTHPQYYLSNCEHAYSIADCMLLARQE